MDPIELIKQDHRTVEALFESYDLLADDAYEEKRELVDEILHELALHANMEETIAYPRFSAALPKDEETLVESAYEEHDMAKGIMAELMELEPDDELFDQRVDVLRESIEAHVAEEEEELLPEAKKLLSETELRELYSELQAFKDEHAT